MALCFLDTSALVKLYARELGSRSLIDLISAESSRCAILALTRVECRAALRRRQRTGEYSKDAVDLLLQRFVRDLSEYFLVQPMDDAMFLEADGLLDRYALRAYDAMQLAGCMRMARDWPDDDLVFACSDGVLARAASDEGVRVFDPEKNENLR
jgi:predicted nucleic acid-binding protein